MQINRVTIQTSALKELTAFYATLMELPVNSKNKNEITVMIGSTELVIQQASAADPFYHFAINIPSDKIEEAKDWLSARVELMWLADYKSEVADFVNWHAKSVYFFDPAGNIVELIARFDLDSKMDEPFSSVQFLSISEIGLVFKTDEFDSSVNKLMQAYKLSYFAKQPPMPQFRAIGDDEGLFIVVPEKRNWYPTGKPSGIFPMQVEFENDARVYTKNI